MSVEHDFGEDVLKAGEKLRAFTAAEDIDQREPVKITGDFEVSVAGDGEQILGVAAYDVADGQEVDVIMDDCEVVVEGSGSGFDAGENVEVVNAAFQTLGDGEKIGVALSGASDGELGDVYLTDSGGNE